MKDLCYLLLLPVLLMFSALAFAASTTISPTGYWKTYNHKTKRASSIIHIYRASDGKYYGKVVKSYANSGEKQLKLCTACKGDRHNQPVIGLVIIRDLVFKKGEYVGGWILDPRDGKEYHCKVKVGKKDQKLYVRGYIGFPLLGRTEIWWRTSSTG